MHDNLRVNTSLMLALMREPMRSRSAEYADNRISLFSAQWGRCAITGRAFAALSDIHCHHKIPKAKGGSDEYGNLCLVLKPVHVLIHATVKETIGHYMSQLMLKPDQMEKLNKLRIQTGNAEIPVRKENPPKAERSAE